MNTQALITLLKEIAPIHPVSVPDDTAVKQKEPEYLQQIRKILGQGININYQDNNGNTLAHLATHCQDGEIMQLLIAAGADLTIKNKNGQTPLHMAFKHKNKGAIRTILESQVGEKLVNMQDNNGNTALHQAAQQGYTQYVKRLIELGADVAVENNRKITALHMAITCRHSDVVTIIIEHAKKLRILDKILSTVDIFGRTPLSHALLGNTHQSVTRTISESSNRKNYHPDDAANAKSILDEIVQVTTEDLEARKSKELTNFSPLQSAIRHGNKELSDAFIDAELFLDYTSTERKKKMQ